MKLFLRIFCFFLNIFWREIKFNIRIMYTNYYNILNVFQYLLIDKNVHNSKSKSWYTEEVVFTYITNLSAGCLMGRSHRVHIFFFFVALVYFSWKETLQNSSHVTPVQKGMSEQIMSEVVLWLGVGQSESCRARLTLCSLVSVFSFHSGVVRVYSSFNERSCVN